MKNLSMNDADPQLAARLRRLEVTATPAFDYEGLVARHEIKRARGVRRLEQLRVACGVVAIAVISASLWRLSPGQNITAVALHETAPQTESARREDFEPSLVRADTYLAVAALEDHIASIDDALNEARLTAPRGVEVARLERTRAELVDSWSSMRYAELVATRF
jgi:hypothetical protein